jgi:murein DD-endopeptidase MepM/ murein hydrolase activator NlpD
LGSGTVVSIDDKNGVLSIKYQDDIITFRHLSEISSDLKPGTEVFEGQIIAKTGKKILNIHIFILRLEISMVI